MSRNFFFFFFNDTATTEIYTLSLHDALPISPARPARLRLRRRIAHAHRGRSAVEPLSPGAHHQLLRPHRGHLLHHLGGDRPRAAPARAAALSHRPGQARSEERRVGKEGRSRWSPYH